MASIEDIEAYANDRQLSFAEAMARYDVVSATHDPAHGSFVVMAERDPRITEQQAMAELGYSSPSPWTAWTREERVPELRDKIGLRTYYDMKRADGTVRGALRLLKTPVLAGRWFIEPASDTALDENIAKFVEKNLFTELNVPWGRVVEDALLMCEYGYFPFEKVYQQDVDGKIKLKKLAPRHPMDIREWIWDSTGGPRAIVMEDVETEFAYFANPINSNGPYQTQITDAKQAPVIPIEKLVVFVLEQEGGDLRGISILRSAYKHYYYKDTLYKIDAIQKERHGIGVPIILLPPGFSQTDRNLAEDLGRNLRTNERAHIVAPNNWQIAFAKLEGQPVDCMKSIEHHDMKIKSNILAPFMDESNVRPDSLDVYYKSTRYIANTICDTFNHFVIPQLVDLNFLRGGYPKMRVRRIGEWEDIRTMSFAFRNFVGAGAIIPDDKLEHFLRNELDLPAPDHKTKRVLSTPQNPNQQNQQNQQNPQSNTPGKPNAPKADMPRQNPQPKASLPRSNSGLDTSGGR